MSDQSAPAPFSAATPFTAAAFEAALATGKLMGARCSACGAVHLPPRSICPACRSSGMEWVELSGRGTLAAFTSIYVPPSALAAQGFDRTNPYVSALVELEEGPLFSARILGVDATQPTLEWIGMPLVATFADATEDAAQPLVSFTKA
jgi:uncharacterized OB-fold protein